MMFSVERTVEVILEFHRFESAKGRSSSACARCWTASGYALYSFTDTNKGVQVSPSTVTTFFEDPDSAFYHFPLENIRRTPPPLLEMVLGRPVPP